MFLQKSLFDKKLFAIATSAILVLAACGANPSASPSNSSASPTPTVTDPIETEVVEVFFVADTPKGFRLFSELRVVPFTNDSGEQVLSDLVSGATQPLDPNYTNLWGSPNELLSLTATSELITVDLAEISLSVGAEAESRAIEQLVWTITGIAGNVPVQFLVEGVAVESFSGHVDTMNPFTRRPGYEVLNDVQIQVPDSNAVLANPVLVNGFACTFEANVAWELLQDGVRVDGGSVLAMEACPTRSAFEIELSTLEPGAYTIRVMEFSAKDGSLSSEDTKTFTLE
jgi:hypothetical protein